MIPMLIAVLQERREPIRLGRLPEMPRSRRIEYIKRPEQFLKTGFIPQRTVNFNV
jgi:hypothetical protein